MGKRLSIMISLMDPGPCGTHLLDRRIVTLNDWPVAKAKRMTRALAARIRKITYDPDTGVAE